ncbi:MAG: PQQ-like beta-propeller repeat protein [Planctomycetaceae bacterium]|nr:PQQ-like beta-propeller repeat protein [Planctomycetaceae bacterium]
MNETVSPPSEEQPTSILRLIGSWLTGLLLLAAAGGLVFVWGIWDPVWGRGMQISVTYGIVVLSSLILLLWFALFSTFRWSSIAGAFALLVLLAGGLAYSVREVEFSGDMEMILHSRWKPTQDQLVQQHREAQNHAEVPETQTWDVSVISDEDAPAYRGVHRDGIIIGPPLRTDWTAEPPTELWRQPCGGGYSSFSVVDDFLVTLEQRGDNEAIVCYDTSTGYERWVYEYPASFSEPLGGWGPRSTPTIDGDTVFSFGALGDAVAVDLLTGEVRWSRDLLAENRKPVQWGMCGSPLVVGEQVIFEAGGPEGDGLISLNRDTGEVLWQRPGIDLLNAPEVKNRAGYSSPQLDTIDGVEQILIFDGEGLRSHDVTTGEQLWFHPFRNDPGVSVAQPIVFEDGRIFLAMSYGVGCTMIRISRNGEAWAEPEELWSNKNMKCKFTSPVLHDGYLYGLDEGILVCIDPETGERKWKGGDDGLRGRFYHGQILLTNDLIVGFTEKGELVLVEPNPEEYRELANLPVFDTKKVWNPLALSRGRAFVRSHEQMAAFDISAP